MEFVIELVFDFIRGTPLVGVLVLLMCADLLSGIMVAISKKQLNSTTSLNGVNKKGYMLLVVGAAAVMEDHADDIPLAKLVAGFFSWRELLSIVENGVALGVPVPKALRDTLEKFRDDKESTVTLERQELKVEQRPKRKSDFVELKEVKAQPPPIQTAEQDGANHPARPGQQAYKPPANVTERNKDSTHFNPPRKDPDMT